MGVADIQPRTWLEQPELPQRHWPRNDLPYAVLAILLVPVAWVVFGGAGLLQSRAIVPGAIDANIYTGYANDYGALLDRFGLNYYSTRVGTIFPEAVLGSVLGRLTGYYAWHYLLAVTALGAIYGIARRYYGAPTAVVVTVLMVAVPWLPGALTWDYPDGAAIAYILLGIYLLLGTRARPALREVAAGCAFSLVFATQAFAGGVAAAFVIAWAIWGFEGRALSPRVYGALRVLAGMAAVQAGLAVFMTLRYPDAGFWFMAENVAATGDYFDSSLPWYLPFGEALRARPYLLVPIGAGLAVFLLAAATRFLRPTPDRRRLIYLSSFFLASCWLYFVWGHHRSISVFSISAYVSFFIPGFVLAGTVVVGELMNRVGATRARVAAFGVSVGLLGAFILFRSGSSHSLPGALVAALGVVIVLALPLSRWQPRLVAGIGLAAIVALPFAFARGQIDQADSYVDVARSSNQVEEQDSYRHAVDFQDGVNTAVPPNKTVGFWYSDQTPWLGAAQSTFLWFGTRIGSPGPGERLELERAQLGLVRKFDYLVLLAPGAEPLRVGVEALCRSGVRLRPVRREVLRGDILTLHYVVFERERLGTCTL